MLIIAEVGVNHNGSLEHAKTLVDMSKSCGANIVKFQTFTAEKLVHRDLPKVHYQTRNDTERSAYEMLQSLELSHNDHEQLFAYCKNVGIEFCSTPYDSESVEFLAALGVERFKVASADIIDLALLDSIAASAVDKVILSTGMASLQEIRLALDMLKMKSSITLLVATSNYPATDESLNLSRIRALQDTFALEIGFSDHSESNVASLVAYGLGARVFERHVTLSKKMPGPDHAASSNPEEFAHYVQSLVRAEKMLGGGQFGKFLEENSMFEISRKKMFASRDLYPGEEIALGILQGKRSQIGIPFSHFEDIRGKILKRPIQAGEPILKEHLS